MARILIADDDPCIRDILIRVLEAAGHEPHSETDGAAALRRIEELRPDAVILDWLMPDMTGVQVCRAIRKSDPIHDIYVIITSALTQPERVREAFEAGADDFLAKPFSPTALVERLASQFPGGLTSALESVGVPSAGESCAGLELAHPAPPASAVRVAVCEGIPEWRAEVVRTLAAAGITDVVEVTSSEELARIDSDPPFTLAVVGNLSDKGVEPAVETFRRTSPGTALIVHVTLRERGHLGALPDHTNFVPAGDLHLLDATVRRILARQLSTQSS